MHAASCEPLRPAGLCSAVFTPLVIADENGLFQIPSLPTSEIWGLIYGGYLLITLSVFILNSMQGLCLISI